MNQPLGMRAFGLIYGFLAVAGSFAFFACFILFLGNLPSRADPWLWPSVDVGPITPAGLALLWNTGLVCLFGLQHSLMARQAFKKGLARYLPAELERATYVHAANAAGFCLILLWAPIPNTLWAVESALLEAVLWGLFAAGWLLLFIGAFSINLFELLGLRQAAAWAAGRAAAPLRLKTGWVFQLLEHPMYLGVLLGMWATPQMSVGHAVLAAQLTLYIAVGMRYERRDLQSRFGRSYEAWRHLPIAPHGGLLSLDVSDLVQDPLPPRISALLQQLASLEPRGGLHRRVRQAFVAAR